MRQRTEREPDVDSLIAFVRELLEIDAIPDYEIDA